METIVTEVTVRYNEADYALGAARFGEYGNDCAAALRALGLNPEDFYSADMGEGYATFRSRLDKVD
jgi:hypothetical protein